MQPPPRPDRRHSATAKEQPATEVQDGAGAIDIDAGTGRDNTPKADIAPATKQRGAFAYMMAPKRTMVLSAHLHRVGTPKTRPASSTDDDLPIAHSLEGS